jgi:hypothetical protein
MTTTTPTGRDDDAETMAKAGRRTRRTRPASRAVLTTRRPTTPRWSPSRSVVDDNDDHARRSGRRCGEDGKGGAPDLPDAPGVPCSADDATADDAAMVAVVVDEVARHMTHIERQ